MSIMFLIHHTFDICVRIYGIFVLFRAKRHGGGGEIVFVRI